MLSTVSLQGSHLRTVGIATGQIKTVFKLFADSDARPAHLAGLLKIELGCLMKVFLLQASTSFKRMGSTEQFCMYCVVASHLDISLEFGPSS